MSRLQRFTAAGLGQSYGWGSLGLLILASAVIADPTAELRLPPMSEDALSDQVYQDAGSWRPPTPPDYGWREEPKPEKKSRIEWGYNSAYDAMQHDEPADLLSSDPASSGPKPTTLLRFRF